LEGAYLNGSLQGVDKLGSLDSSISLGTFRGFNGALTLNKKISEIWDIQGNIAYAGFLDQKTSTSSYSSSGGATYLDEASSIGGHAFQTADIEIGYRPPAFANDQLRIFGGLRALRSSKSYDVSGTETDLATMAVTSSGQINYSSKFQGLGIRGGASAAIRFPQSNFGASALVAGSIIYGRESIDYGFDYGNDSILSASDTRGKAVYNLDATLGVDWHLNSTTVLTSGYKVQEYWNIGENLYNSQNKTNDLIHGPFLKYISSF
jgi:hypothetical protein